MKHNQRIQVEKEPEICEEKAMEAQVSEKLRSDQAVGKFWSFDAVNSLFKCRICDGSCTSKLYLISHIEIAHGVEKIFVCSICGHLFSQKNDLTKHSLLQKS